MSIINDAESLKKVLDKNFKFHADFLRWLDNVGFAIPKETLSRHISGSKKILPFHAMAYTFAVEYYKANVPESN